MRGGEVGKVRARMIRKKLPQAPLESPAVGPPGGGNSDGPCRAIEIVAAGIVGGCYGQLCATAEDSAIRRRSNKSPSLNLMSALRVNSGTVSKMVRVRLSLI
jgi:hypothetical protein